MKIPCVPTSEHGLDDGTKKCSLEGLESGVIGISAVLAKPDMAVAKQSSEILVPPINRLRIVSTNP
jgi:hypothetical protein